MTSGFSLPFPPVDHPDNPDHDPTLIFAFNLWIQAKLDAFIHKSNSRDGGTFFLWGIEDGGIKFSPEFTQSHPASVNFDTSAPDTARMAPRTASDFYWEDRKFELRAVFDVHGKEDTSIIVNYGDDPKDKIQYGENPVWQYAKECSEDPEPRKLIPPPYGAGNLKVHMSMESGCNELGPLLNDRNFVGYGTRLLADDGHCRTIYRFYTKKIPYSMTPETFTPNIPKELHPSVDHPERSFAADLWMRGDPKGLGFTSSFPGDKKFSTMNLIEGELYFPPNKYPGSPTPSATMLPETGSDWMVSTPKSVAPEGVDIQLRVVWKTKAGYPLWMWYKGGLEDKSEFDKFSREPVTTPQPPFGVGGFNAVIRFLTEDPELNWVSTTRFHAHGTRILQADGVLRTTYRLYKENKPAEVKESTEIWGRFL